MNLNSNPQQDFQDGKVSKGKSEDGQLPHQPMGFQKMRMFNISKSIAFKHSQPISAKKSQQNAREQQNRIQNQSNELLSKLIQKLSQKQNQRDQKLEELNENMNKLVKLFVEKWTQPEKNHQISTKLHQNSKENVSHLKLQTKQEQTVNQKIFNKKLNKQQNQECKQAQIYSNEYHQEFQSRLKVISVKMLSKNSSRNQVLVWVGNMCKKVLSVGFKLYKNDELDIKKVKVFCSENILRNLIQLPKQIKQEYWSVIDNCLKTELFPYFRFNYPQTEENGISKLSNILVEKETFNENQNNNDLVLLSGVKFDLQEDENYNPQIMQLLNYVVTLPNLLPGLQENKKNDNNSLNKLFKNDMERIFQFIQLEQNVEEIKSFNPSKPQSQLEQKYIKLYIQKNFTIEAKNNRQINKNEQQIKENESKYRQKTMTKQRKQVSAQSNNQSLKYKQKVKSFTSQEIGQKLPQNLELFSKYEIQNGNLKLNNSSLMRVVAKWCSQLQQYFDPKEILDREQTWKMKDGSEKYLQKNQMIALNTLLQREKQTINTKLQQIRKNSYQNQIQFSNREIHQKLKKFSEEEATVGQFCSSVFKINEAYLIKYLNLLIHGINRALRDFQKIQRANREFNRLYQNIKFEKNQEQILKYLQIFLKNIGFLKDKSEALSQTPQLITFKIGDLLRCKCTSKEYEITSIYKLVQYLSHTKPQFIKIIRVRNKLNQGNKDILMNILYRQSMVVEMQLAIKSEKSKFIECSNKFNHYFYQLQRSQFGPIMEMCSIWSSQDQRSKFYLSKIQQNNKREKSRKLDQCCLKSSNNQINLPFKCKVCYYTYYECNFYQKHSKCSKCNIYICFLCQFEQADQENKEQLFPPLKQYKKLASESLKTCNSIPKNGGLLININSKVKKMKIFKPIIYKKECHLFSYVLDNNKEVLQVLEKSQFKQKRQEGEQQQNERQLKQIQGWFEALSISNLVFECPELDKKYQELDKKKVQMQYFIPKYFEKIAKSQKKSVALIKKELTQNVFSSIKSQINSIQKINFSENKLSQIKVLIQMFPNTELALLNNNNIKNIEKKDLNFWSESLTHLYLSHNKLMDVSAITVLKKLVKLNLSGNQIKQIPEQFFITFKSLEQLNLSNNYLKCLLTKQKEVAQLPNLTNLNINNNKLLQLPESFGNLQNLIYLNIESNQLSSLPESFVKLKNIINLNIASNKLPSIPEFFKNFKNIINFNISQNQLSTLPESLGNLKNITNLQISSNKISSLPDSFRNLKNITNLSLKKNQLSSLPEYFGNFKNLTSFSIYSNKLSYLPESFGNLQNLTNLYIDHNKLSYLPESFGNLYNLTNLSIGSNNLSSLPKSFGNLKNLIQLNIESNQLSFLPESFGNLENLTQLEIFGSKLYSLPESFGNLKNLTLLAINQNYLSSLPESFGNLKSLIQLQIGGNLISFLPKSFGNLKNLIRLNIERNLLSSLPESFGNIKDLTQLNFQRNKLSSLPESFGSLQKLTKLNISHNKLFSLPESFGNLENLTQLKIYKNYLEHLPDQFSNLKNLKTLEIYDNNLTEMPASFRKLESLQKLSISDQILYSTLSELDNETHIKEILTYPEYHNYNRKWLKIYLASKAFKLRKIYFNYRNNSMEPFEHVQNQYEDQVKKK